jgi:hypothetical protein
MRARAYRPEVRDFLEDRLLLSGVARPSADPVILSRRQLIIIGEHIHSAFTFVARNHDPTQLRPEINDLIVNIPFGGVDGLVGSIDRILNRMKLDVRAHVPHASASARDSVLAVTLAQVEARVRAGDVIVR